MKAFNLHSDQELLKLTNEEMDQAIRLEAVERGIKPPLTLPEALKASEWRGFKVPAQSIPVFTFGHSYERSPFGYLTMELAKQAMEGMVHVERTSYGVRQLKISEKAPEIITEWVGVSLESSKAAKFEKYCQDADDEKFKTLRDECLERFGRVRQAAYDSKVRAFKKSEYLKLAAGNEDIAKAFWSKTEGTAWPEEPPYVPES